jgi:hypothetical protein
MNLNNFIKKPGKRDLGELSGQTRVPIARCGDPGRRPRKNGILVIVRPFERIISDIITDVV